MPQPRNDEFVGIVCHELKTPLTVLTAIIQTLTNKLKENEDVMVAKCLNRAETQVKKMGNMVNDFLNIAFWESGNVCINRQNFKLAGLIGEQIEECRELQYNRIMHFHCNCDTELYADREKIGCVISNLICNAMKYSANHSNIYISVFKSATDIIVRIRDEGIGIKTDHLEKLFDRYFRADSVIDSAVPGFGIGLYLCAAIIKQHDGKIWAESEFGTGSVFYFCLPLNTQQTE
jgi:signal transduction histidine kinase